MSQATAFGEEELMKKFPLRPIGTELIYGDCIFVVKQYFDSGRGQVVDETCADAREELEPVGMVEDGWKRYFDGHRELIRDWQI